MPGEHHVASPIVMRPWEVAATLAGRKTMKRSPIEDVIPWATEWFHDDRSGKWMPDGPSPSGKGFAAGHWRPCPWGKVGDRLNILEPWAVRGSHTDKATSSEVAMNPGHYQVWTHSQCFENGRERFNLDFLGRWRSPEEMPLWAAKHAVENCGVRVERLGDISIEDAFAEGLDDYFSGVYFPGYLGWSAARANYRRHWESMYGAGSWDPAKWVWVVGCRPVEGE